MSERVKDTNVKFLFAGWALHYLWVLPKNHTEGKKMWPAISEKYKGHACHSGIIYSK